MQLAPFVAGEPLDLTPAVFFAKLARVGLVKRLTDGPALSDQERLQYDAERELDD